MRVLLVDMPFGLAERPSLGLSLLKPVLEEAGVACDITYPNLEFARRAGVRTYRRVSNELRGQVLAGEWVFSECLFGSTSVSLSRYASAVVARHGQSLEIIEDLRHLRALAGPFLSDWVASVDLGLYDVIGFTSACDQNVAALAAARLLKELRPETIVVFGGPNWDGEMGKGQLMAFPFVDFACLGEADLSLPSLLSWLEWGRRPIASPGRRCQEAGSEVVVGDGDWLLRDLDALPRPDYDDYFEAVERLELTESLQPSVSIEGSRGCWWTRSGPCTFCGQNGTTRRYRTKSAARIVNDLHEAGEICQSGLLEMTDNAVPRLFTRSVLPALADTSLPKRLFFEARPDLSKEEVAQAGALGCRVQFGIESFSDHTLALMRKGTTALDNVRLLVWCEAFGLPVAWNLLFGVPGETEDDLAEVAALVPRLTHLHPPRNCSPVTIDRFSAYFDDPEAYGLGELRPMEPYSLVYPLGEESVRSLAYSFQSEREESGLAQALQFRIVKEVRRWQHAESRATLRRHSSADGRNVIEDSRPAFEVGEYELDALEAAMLLIADDGCPSHAFAGLAGRSSAGVASRRDIEIRLRLLQERGLLVVMGGRSQSLALPLRRRRSPSVRPPSRPSEVARRVLRTWCRRHQGRSLPRTTSPAA